MENNRWGTIQEEMDGMYELSLPGAWLVTIKKEDVRFAGE